MRFLIFLLCSPFFLTRLIHGFLSHMTMYSAISFYFFSCNLSCYRIACCFNLTTIPLYHHSTTAFRTWTYFCPSSRSYCQFHFSLS
ncbi:hypothetical protein GALMADRAFT_880591 [Galerina marginata CBS 339.88]|uniref:Uncharacterized protein n=1 Tax=Galerina marginata (strain CBS 339.88) TaxID=685588 RepID=A0A067SI86_GALM3|nr:hypothetical protein GALMADRAFT_880591 [Galerina marginata CBS 339.88]